eukprot:jgi/Galph1/2772/GphlegSOOS_G1435.1
MTYSPYSVTNDKSGGHIVPGTFSRFEFLEVFQMLRLESGELFLPLQGPRNWEKRRSITKATLESLRKPASEMEKLTSLGQYNEVYRRTLKIFNDPSDGVGKQIQVLWPIPY